MSFLPRDKSFWVGAALGVAAAGGAAAFLSSRKPARLTGATLEERVLRHVMDTAVEGDAASVLAAIDVFCHRSDGWMMNVGDEKGAILASVVRDTPIKLAVEYGGYCGYSAVLIASLLPPEARLISIEINASYAAIATKIIEFAGLAHKVRVVVEDVERYLPRLMASHGEGCVDLLFIDHWKQLYLPHMRATEASKLLHRGSVIVADNIIFPGAPDYLAYMQASPAYATRVHEAHLEYKTDVRDAVAVSRVL